MRFKSKAIKKVFVFNTLSINTGVLYKLSENKDLNIQYNYIERAQTLLKCLVMVTPRTCII